MFIFYVAHVLTLNYVFCLHLLSHTKLKISMIRSVDNMAIITENEKFLQDILNTLIATLIPKKLNKMLILM